MKNQHLATAHHCLLSIEEATTALGVSRQTLYAYTSRGLIRAVINPADPRRSLYDPGDIRALKERKGRGRSRREVAAATIDWGDPILRSGITQIVDGKPFFRGQDAIELSRSATLEDIAALHWQSGPPPSLHGETPAQVCANDWRSRPPGQRCLEAVAAMATAGSWSVSQERALPDAYL